MADRLYLAPQLPLGVLVVGSVAYDGVITPKQQVDRTLGGAASYAALAASFFAPVRLVGVVGRDFDRLDRLRFERRGVDLQGLQVDLSGDTFFWKGRYVDDFRRRETLETQLNVFENFHPKLPVDYTDSPFLCLGNIDPELQVSVLDQMVSRPFVVADTMNFWINTKRHGVLALLKRINGLVINDEEAILLTSEPNLIVAGNILQSMGPRLVIIKKGEHGALLFYDKDFFVIPGYPVEHLEDPTGAGDTFAGAFVGALSALHQTDFAACKRALVYATAAASLTVEGFSVDRLERGGAPEIARRVALLKQYTSLH